MVEININLGLWGRPNITSLWIKDEVLGEMDFTDYMEDYSFTKKRNSVGTGEVSLNDIGDNEKEWIKIGSLVKAFSEDKLVFKGRIANFSIDSFNNVDVNIDEISMKARDSITSRSDFTYEQVDTSTIINNLTSGIFSVGTNTNFGKIDVRYEYENKLNAIIALAQQTNNEWRIRNEESDNYETDYLDFAPSLGSASSVFSFITSGSSHNTTVTANNTDKNSIINKVIVLGSGDGINQYTGTNSHATTNRTKLNGGDTYLSADMGISDTTVTVYSTTGFPSTGRIRIDDEQIDYTGKTSTTFTGLTRGVNGTNPAQHTTSVDVIGYTSLVVDSTSLFSASGTLLIGNETITYTGKTATTFTGITRGASSTIPYSHEDNIEVRDGQYTDTVSGSQTGSSIKDNGILIGTYTDKTLATQNAVDLVSQWIINDRKDPVIRISVVPMDLREVLNSVNILDTVTITDTETELSGTYKVISMALSSRSGSEQLVLEISSISNSFLDLSSSTAKSTEIQGKYEQGSTNLMMVGPVAENCDNSTNGALFLRFYVSPEVIAINSVKLNFKIADYRRYTKDNYVFIAPIVEKRYANDNTITEDFLAIPAISDTIPFFQNVWCMAYRNDSNSSQTYTFQFKDQTTGEILATAAGVGLNDKVGYSVTLGINTKDYTDRQGNTIGIVVTNGRAYQNGVYERGDKLEFSFKRLTAGIDTSIGGSDGNVSIYIGNDGNEVLVASNLLSTSEYDITDNIPKGIGWKSIKIVPSKRMRIEATTFIQMKINTT